MDNKDNMLEVDDNFGLDDSDEDNDDQEFMPQEQDPNQQVANFDDMGDDDEDEDDDEDFNQHQDGENMDDNDIPNDPDDEDDDDDGNNYKRPDFAFNSGEGSAKKNNDLNTEKVENQQFDEALDIDDSNEIESEDDDNDHDLGGAQASQSNQAKMGQGDDDDDDDDQVLPGQYNPANYAGLNVSSEVKELFEYIGRYKPQKINLETTFRPFIPEFIPCVGEVDAFLKMSKPDGSKEDFGITVLDEPALNHTDPSVLEMKYYQHKQTGKKVEVTIRSIDNAEKNPKDIQNWIKNVNDLHEGRPAPTVQYTKRMPDFDTLMEEWPPAIENVLKAVKFPGPDIEVSTEDYAKIMLTMLDIPVHNLPENKGIIEGLHMMFTLYSTFKENQHFQKQQQQQINQERDEDHDFMAVNH